MGCVDEDGAALRAARAGDLAAFNRLVLRHQDAVYSLCVRLTGNAEDGADATQEAFLAAYRHLDGFRGGVFRSWLFRIAANCCYDALRVRRRRPTDSLDRPSPDSAADGPPALDPPDPAAGPEATALHREMAEVIQRGLLELPEDQRLAVVLCDLYGFDYAAIADATETELGTVKSRINRGRRRLRDYLLRHGELLPSRYRLIT
jgi:RNA polymerase sigma factor (sigma-70 family)